MEARWDGLPTKVSYWPLSRTTTSEQLAYKMNGFIEKKINLKKSPGEVWVTLVENIE